MSQIVRAIIASDTGDRKVFQDTFSPLFQDVFDMKEKYSSDAAHQIAMIYKIGVTLGNQVAVSEYETITGKDDVLTMAINRTKKQVIEAIFGEFREDFMRISMALYDRDFNKSRTLLGEFETKMFSTD